MPQGRAPDDESFDECVRSAFEAAHGRLSWKRTAETIAGAYGLFAVQIIGVDKSDGRLMFSWTSSRASGPNELSYITEYHGENPRIAPALQLQGDAWIRDHDLFDDSFVARSRFFQDFAIPFGYRFLSGTKLVDDARQVVLFGAISSAEAGPLSDETMASLTRLRRHLCEAMDIHLMLGERHEQTLGGTALLEALPWAVLLIDETRRIAWSNERAGALRSTCRLGDIDSGHFSLADPRDDNRLTAEINDSMRSAATGQGDGPRRFALRIGEPDTGSDALVLGLLLRPEETMKAFGHSPRLMLIVHPLRSTAAPDPFLVGQVFGLSPAESIVAVRLATGESPEAISRDRGVSIFTIRSQIRMILDKVSVSRQVDLAGILARLPITDP